jgi:hypothetical protein
MECNVLELKFTLKYEHFELSMCTKNTENYQFLMNLFIFYSGLNIKQRPLLQNLLPDSLGPSLKT